MERKLLFFYYSRGRIRADIEEFIIAPNKRGVKRTIENTLKDFKEVLPMSQIEMAQKYGAYMQRKKLKSDAPPTVLSPTKDHFISNYSAMREGSFTKKH